MKIDLVGVSQIEPNSIKNIKLIKEKLENLKDILQVNNLNEKISKDEIYFSRNNILLEQNISEVLEEIKDIANQCPAAEFALTNSKNLKMAWKQLYDENQEFRLLNFFSFLGNVSSFFIYRSNEYRNKIYLPVGDNFYLDIPAKKTMQLPNGSIVVQLVDNFDEFDELYRALKKTVKYFINFLKQKGLFGKLDINNWRTVNKDLLVEKGFILPEWK